MSLQEAVLADLNQAANRSHAIVLAWHMDNPGQQMPDSVEVYAVLLADLQTRIRRLEA